SKRIWLAWHDPERRTEPEPGTPMAIGLEVGRSARVLIPGGVLVEEAPYEHDEAIKRTKRLMADPNVPAIFEAAFEFDQVRIRVDILERFPDGWRFCEVKSSTRVKDEHLDEMAVQWHVLESCGV